MVRALLRVYVRPAARAETLRVEGDEVVFETPEPPVRGRANAALVKALSKSLGVPKTAVRVVRGASSRFKVVAVEGLETEEALRRLRRS